MAYEINPTILSFEAAADLSAKQYYWVKLNTVGKIVLAEDGERAIGILQDCPESGEMGAVAVAGVSKLKSAATLDAGMLIASDLNAKAIEAASGDHRLAVALKPAVAGDLFEVLIQASAVS